MPAHFMSAKQNASIAASFPEIAENLKRIEQARLYQAAQLQYARTGGGKDIDKSLPARIPRYYHPSLIDERLGTYDLGRDAIDNRMAEFGGRGHQGAIAGLIGLHVKESMPYHEDYMPSRRESRLVAEIK